MIKEWLMLRYNTSESDICYRLRKELDNLWYIINQEVRVLTKEKENNWHARKPVARFDLFINRKLVIEVKNKWSAKWLAKQVKRYEDIWFDVITCIWDKQIKETIKKVQEYF